MCIVKILVPIFVGDNFVGAVGACGKCLDDGEVDTFLVNKVTDIEEEKVESLAQDIEVISTETTGELITFVQEKLQDIIQQYESGH